MTALRLLDTPIMEIGHEVPSAVLAAEILELDSYIERVRLYRDMRRSVLRARMLHMGVDTLPCGQIRVNLRPRMTLACECHGLSVNGFTGRRHPGCDTPKTTPIAVTSKAFTDLADRELRVVLDGP